MTYIENMSPSSQDGSRKICGRQPSINFKRYGLPKADHMPSNF